MKKLILLAAFAIISVIAFGQATFGFQAGGNLAFGKQKFNTDPTYPVALTNDPKVGFLVGVLGEIPIGSKLAFRPELNFIQKGGKSNSTFTFFGSTSGYDQNITLNYIQLPLNVVYKLPVGSGNFFFGLGPELAFGISGKDKISSKTDPSDPDVNRTATVKFDGKKSDDITDPKDNDLHLKRFDAGANIIAGYQLGMGVFLSLATLIIS